MPNVPALRLNTGADIPQVGFGVFQVPPQDTKAAVLAALEAGYRSIDTARAYRNEQQVGEAIAESGIDRDEIFITTKLWNDAQGLEVTRRAFDHSLELMGIDEVDLYLIHWPVAGADLFVDAWREMEGAQDDGRARSIGVSNFQVHHLQRLLDECDVVPAVNQIELHPRLQQAELRAFHDEHDIATEAWSPLAQGQLLEDATLLSIAEKHGRPTAQVILRWHLQLGNVVIPKSINPGRIQSNIELFDFELSPQQMKGIGYLDVGEEGRLGPHPDDFGA